MGRPFDIIESPGEAEETDSSSSEDEAAGSGDDEGWVVAHEAEDVWDDPSDGMLAQVFDAAEAGDAAGLADLLQGLQVSLDTRVSVLLAAGLLHFSNDCHHHLPGQAQIKSSGVVDSCACFPNCGVGQS